MSPFPKATKNECCNFENYSNRDIYKNCICQERVSLQPFQFLFHSPISYIFPFMLHSPNNFMFPNNRNNFSDISDLHKKLCFLWFIFYITSILNYINMECFHCNSKHKKICFLFVLFQYLFTKFYIVRMRKYILIHVM